MTHGASSGLSAPGVRLGSGPAADQKTSGLSACGVRLGSGPAAHGPSASQAALAAGRLVFAAGASPPIRGGRPLVQGEVLCRLAEGRRAAMLPDLLGALFSLCGAVHRLTARHAVAAALGIGATDADTARTTARLRAATLRDHLQRLALDLPSRVPVGVAGAPTWLARAPLPMLPASACAPGHDDELASGLQRMQAWLTRHLLGAPARDWWRAWLDDPARAAARWALGQDHPVARWHAAVHERAASLRLPCRPLALLEGDPVQVRAGMRELARALDADAGFAARPLWLGGTAETGPWTRCLSSSGHAVDTAWLRLASRIADIARIACDEQALRHGALALGDGEGIAWSEMARGLLVHWVRLEPGSRDPALARVQACRVLAPTEWNFHPDGGFAHWLSKAAPDAASVALAAAALDPCVDFEVCEGAAAGSVNEAANA